MAGVPEPVERDTWSIEALVEALYVAGRPQYTDGARAPLGAPLRLLSIRTHRLPAASAAFLFSSPAFPQSSLRS
jgi:hypothetical protein